MTSWRSSSTRGGAAALALLAALSFAAPDAGTPGKRERRRGGTADAGTATSRAFGRLRAKVGSGTELSNALPDAGTESMDGGATASGPGLDAGSAGPSALALESPDGGAAPTAEVPDAGTAAVSSAADAGAASVRTSFRSPERALKVALLPLTNWSGGPAQLDDVEVALAAALRAHDVDVVAGAELEPFLAKHRIRYSASVDQATAIAAGEELGVGGIVIGMVELYNEGPPPRLALGLRLVSSDRDARIYWMDGFGRAGDDDPGPFGLWKIGELPELRDSVVDTLASSLGRFLHGQATRAGLCKDDARFRPSSSFRSPLLDPTKKYSVAVLPFVNESRRRDAGEVVALELARQLNGIPNLQIVEPGLVREELLRFRIVMEGGISLDTARVLLELVQADLVLAGYVRELQDPGGDRSTPAAEFTAIILDRQNNEVVWQSTSNHRGDDGVFFFDFGRVSTSQELLCRMGRQIAARISVRPE